MTVTLTPPADDSPVVSSRPRRLVRTGLDAVRRVPLTMSVIVVLLAIGIATGTLWSPVAEHHGLAESVSYGLPALRAGRWWTFLTGSLVLPQPVLFVSVIGLLVAGLGFYERRVGSFRAALALFGTQLAGILLTALALWPFASGNWAWAHHLAGTSDVGLSAGGLGVLAAATALMSAEWRARVRVAVGAYLLIMLVKAGLLWDIEHLFSFVVGLVAGPYLAGRRPQRLAVPRFGRAQQRNLVALVIAAIAIGTLVESLFPGNGGPFQGGQRPIDAFDASVVLTVVSFAMLALADALRRGRRAAWWLAVGGIGLLEVGTLTNPMGAAVIVDTLVYTTLLTLLVLGRDAWAWTSNGHTRRLARRLAVTAASIAAVSFSLICLLHDEFGPAHGIGAAARQVGACFGVVGGGPLAPRTVLASVVLDLTSWVWGLAVVVFFAQWLYATRRPASERSDDAIRSTLECHGGGSIGWMRTWPGFETWTAPESGTAITYRNVGTVAIVLGDPVGPRSGWREAIRGFEDFCDRAGWVPCAFAATTAIADVAVENGWRATQIGEDAVVELGDLEFKGKSWQDVRTARNHAARDGISFHVVSLADSPPVIRDQVEAISRGWVADKPLPEMGFTLGTVEHALDPAIRTHLAIDEAGTVHGVTTWLPVHRDGQIVGWALDVMRRRADGFRPVIEYLIAESALAFQEAGYESMSLSVAPLARRAPLDADDAALDRALVRVSKILEPTYGFRSLLGFKAKFHPRFDPVFLVYRSDADLLEISVAIGRAYLPHLSPSQLGRLARSTVQGSR